MEQLETADPDAVLSGRVGWLSSFALSLLTGNEGGIAP